MTRKKTQTKIETMTSNYILIDLSYFIFYRYFALIQWWKLAKPDDDIGVPIENEEFVEKFKKTFIEKLLDIKKKLKLKDAIFIGGRDCPRGNIWRNELFDKYKGTRGQDDAFMGGPFFKLAYKELLTNALFKAILYFDGLEADDCIALTAKRIRVQKPDAMVYIIANDMDYLQIASDKTQIINLKFKNLQASKSSYGNAVQDLFCKIVLGDKSDNIPGIFKKCGPKMVVKYYENRELFEAALEKEPSARVNFEKNKNIIDFENIPKKMQDEFYKTNWESTGI